MLLVLDPLDNTHIRHLQWGTWVCARHLNPTVVVRSRVVVDQAPAVWVLAVELHLTRFHQASSTVLTLEARPLGWRVWDR